VTVASSRAVVSACSREADSPCWGGADEDEEEEEYEEAEDEDDNDDDDDDEEEEAERGGEDGMDMGLA